jgi:two-component system OmpR family response regulator
VWETGSDGVTVPRIAPHLLVGIRILVVEDDDDSREVLAQILSLEGASVMTVSTASEALAMLPGADIVLTDFALPSDDGVWLLERVNKQPRPIPVIVMSGFDEGQEPRLATAPFAGKLLNPVDFDRRYAEIATALGDRG